MKLGGLILPILLALGGTATAETAAVRAQRHNDLGTTVLLRADKTISNSTVWTGATAPTATAGVNCSNWSVASSAVGGIWIKIDTASVTIPSASPATCDSKQGVLCLQK